MIITVTSADDSLALVDMVDNGYLKKISNNKVFSSYLNLKGNVIHFACNGESPNLATHMSPKDLSLALPYIYQLLIGYGIVYNKNEFEHNLLENKLISLYLDVCRDLILRNHAKAA